jgi:hypothetical protein
MYSIAAHTGVRRSEIIPLSVTDLDFESRTYRDHREETCAWQDHNLPRPHVGFSGGSAERLFEESSLQHTPDLSWPDGCEKQEMSPDYRPFVSQAKGKDGDGKSPDRHATHMPGDNRRR